MLRFKEFIKESPDKFDDTLEWTNDGTVVFSTISNTIIYSATQYVTHNELMLVSYYREVGKQQFVNDVMNEATGVWPGTNGLDNGKFELGGIEFDFEDVYQSAAKIKYIGNWKPHMLLLARTETGDGATDLNGRWWTRDNAMSVWEDINMLKAEFPLVKKLVRRLRGDIKKLRFEIGDDILTYKDLMGRSAEKKFTGMSELKGQAHASFPGKWRQAMRELDDWNLND